MHTNLPHVRVMHQLYLKKTLKLIFVICLQLTCLLLSPMQVSADDYTSPETIPGSKRINAEELIELARETEDLVIIDARISADRHQGFIADSISLPDTETSCTSLLLLIDHKDSPVVFYCNGPKCRRSDRAVIIAHECGYSNIYWFRGGFEEWKNKEYLISK